MLFDSLAVTSRQQRYLQFEGRIASLGNFAETLPAACGGLTDAMVSHRAVYLSQAIIAAPAVSAALLLLNPSNGSVHKQPGHPPGL